MIEVGSLLANFFNNEDAMVDQQTRQPAAVASMQTTAAAGFKVHPDHLDAKPGDGVRALRPAEPDPDEPRELATVRPGRSVDVPDSIEKRAVGYDRDTGKSIYAAVQHRYGPGQQVELPVSEIRRLRGLGFLVDPNDAPVFTSDPLS